MILEFDRSESGTIKVEFLSAEFCEELKKGS
jgi:hypothetical protein